MTGLQPLPRVIELDRKQLEYTMTLTDYLQRVVSPARVQHGKRRFKTHRELLARVSAAHGVQPRFVVALWGIESDYGRAMGGFPVIAALATLAHDGRRSTFFRGELLHALQILDQGHIQPQTMMGSWAGAMGQSQFMPSSFRQYAIDYNGDGRRDIWTSLGDIFASIANYLARTGWRGNRTWGRRVTLLADIDPALAGLNVQKPLPAWQQLGIRRADGSDLPRQPLQASLLLPEGPKGPAYLVYQNFRTLLKWNRSHYFALAVGKLADALRDN
ncbi:Tn3 family transposase TnXax1 [Candidatus Entotheonellaceae bacterium PAL068K]